MYLYIVYDIQYLSLKAIKMLKTFGMLSEILCGMVSLSFVKTIEMRFSVLDVKLYSFCVFLWYCLATKKYI